MRTTQSQRRQVTLSWSDIVKATVSAIVSILVALVKGYLNI
jgi:hypothetical protein